MKAFLLILLSLVAIAYSRSVGPLQDIDVHVKVEVKCEKVLGPERCAELKKAAETLKEKAEVIDALVKKAVEDGWKRTEDIVKRVRSDLIRTAKDFKCEDVLNGKLCDEIRDFTGKLKIDAAEVEKMVKELIVEGVKGVKELYEKIWNKIMKRVQPDTLYKDIDVDVKVEISCEKILGEARCAELEKAAEVMKQKAEEVKVLVKKAVQDGLKKSEDIVKRVRADLVAKEKDFKCEDVLAGKLCDLIRGAAEKLKVKAEEVDQMLKETIAEGITSVRGIYKKILESIKERLHPRNSALYKDIDVDVHIEISCEKILGEEKCAELEKAAKKLKEKAKVVDSLVRKAVLDGLKKTEEIIQRVRSDLVAKAKNFKCEDLLAGKLCDMIRGAAEKLKVKAEEVDQMLKETIAEGITSVRGIYKKILESIKERLHPRNSTLYKDIDVDVHIEISCEKILGEEKCAELEKAAKTLKEKAKVVDSLVRKAVLDGLKKTEEIIQRVRSDLVARAKNFKCEDILAGKLCDMIRGAAEKLKVKAEEVDQMLKATIAEGITSVRGIYKKILESIKERLHPRNSSLYKDIDVDVHIEISCEKILGEEKCADLEKAAKTLKEKAKVVDSLVRKAVLDGLKKTEEIIQRVRSDLVAKAKNFKCEHLLAGKLCDIIRGAAGKLKVKAEEVDKMLKEAVAEGISSVRHIYKRILELIKERLHPNDAVLYQDIDVDVHIEISCQKILGEERCAELEKAAETLKEKAKVVDALVRKAVIDGVKKSEEIIKRVRSDLAAQAQNFKCEDLLAGKLCDMIRGAAEKLKVKAEEVDQMLKEIVAQGITSVKGIYKKILELIKERLHPSNLALYKDIDVDVHIEISCEKILGKERCAELEAAAETLKEKVKIVDALVKKAVMDGVKKSEEIIKRVRSDLVAQAKNFKCEDLLAGKLCDMIRGAAEKLKVKAEEVDQMLKETVAQDVDVDIHIEISCEKILGEERCAELEKAAETLKEKAKVVDALVRKAVMDGVKKSEEIIKRVLSDLVAQAKNFKCEDLLAGKLCDIIRGAAEKLKVKAEEVDKMLKETVAEGITSVRRIIKHTLQAIKARLHPDNAASYKNIDAEVHIEISCEKILGKERCAALEKTAETLKQKAKLVDALVKKAVLDGLKKSEEIIKRVRADLLEKANNFKCEDVLAERLCEEIHGIAGKLSIKAEEVEEMIKETVVEGIKGVKSMYEKLLHKIMERIG